MLGSHTQADRPLYDLLQEHSKKACRRYHIPGHAGYNFDTDMWRALASWDVTEVLGMDDLHDATGVIAAAQQLAAQAFAAARTFFLVNGTSAGIIAAMSALFVAGDQLVIQRNAHKSVHNAVAMRSLHPHYLQPEIMAEGGMAGVVCAEDLQKILAEHPGVKGVVLTNPTFYGHIADIEKLAAICQARGVLLIVDEAHGAHFAFAESTKQHCGMLAGADLVIQSAHKTLPALTQASLLHLSHRALARLDVDNLQWWLSAYQTTSPSYLLMASLDYARHWMMRHGTEALGQAQVRKNKLSKKLEEIAGINACDSQWQLAGRSIDSLKLTLPIPTAVKSSKQLEELLAERDIFIELTGPNHILLVLPLLYEQALLQESKIRMDSGKVYSASELSNYDDKLIEVLSSISQGQQVITKKTTNWPQELPELVMLPGDLLADKLSTKIQAVALDNAMGRIVAEYVIPYPPGIPLLCPGERVSRQVLEYVSYAREDQTHFQGLADASATTLRCLA